jgi:hypothetical protein
VTRDRRGVLILPCAGVVLVVAVMAIPAGRPRVTFAGQSVHQQPHPPLSILREHRYRMTAAIRPFLLFWMRRASVGGARIVWRRGEAGEQGYELLIGSDPRRAPKGINHWGYVEEHGGEQGAAALVGVMRQTDEQSTEEAKAGLATEGQEGYFFRMIRQSVGAGEITSEVVTLRVASDFSYRDLDALLKAFESAPGTTRTRRAKLAPATRPGFLTAVAELVRQSVEASRSKTGRPNQAARTISFTFDATTYDLTLRSSEYLETARFGDRSFARVVRDQFETLNRETKNREQFTLVCGLDGAFMEVPVFISYQPEWWFKAELVLDDGEAF